MTHRFAIPNEHNMTNTTIEKTLKPGSTLWIDFMTFKVTEECQLTIEGTLGFTLHDRPYLNSNFTVKCKAITLDALIESGKGYLNERYTINDKKVYEIKTSTDIGGHHLSVESADGEMETLCHLSNGFGDGMYTLRFTEGMHTR